MNPFPNWRCLWNKVLLSYLRIHVIQKIWLKFPKLQDILLPTEDVLLAYNLISQIVTSCNMGAENFIHSLTKLLMVQKICTETSVVNCSSLLLSFEIANHVLAYLTGAMTFKDGLPCDDSNSDIFSEKRCFLIAGKYFWENISFPEYTYVQIKGSWWFIVS